MSMSMSMFLFKLLLFINNLILGNFLMVFTYAMKKIFQSENKKLWSEKMLCESIAECIEEIYNRNVRNAKEAVFRLKMNEFVIQLKVIY